MTPQTTLELDIVVAQGCSNPECTHDHTPDMYFRSACHPEIPGTAIKYDKRDHCLHLECGQCGQPIVVIKVAEPEIRTRKKRK